MSLTLSAHPAFAAAARGYHHHLYRRHHFCRRHCGGASGKESACRCRRLRDEVQPLSWEDPLEKGMATHSTILAWRAPWTEEPGGLQSMGSQRVRHSRAHTYMMEKQPFGRGRCSNSWCWVACQRPPEALTRTAHMFGGVGAPEFCFEWGLRRVSGSPVGHKSCTKTTDQDCSSSLFWKPDLEQSPIQ